MSEENVEIVRRGFEVWNTGDMDALRELYDPGIVWRPAEGWPEPGPYAGREAVMRQWQRNREPWGDAATIAPISIIDAGDRVGARRVLADAAISAAACVVLAGWRACRGRTAG